MNKRIKNFALLGLAGYIAPRHLKAIKETGNKLSVTLDKHDNVGIIDSYFPDADFFTEPERFERHIYKIQHAKDSLPIDFFSICTPNYLHDAHIRMALCNHADAICEKPLVLNPWNVDCLAELEKETGKKIHTILQLRCHPAVVKLKNTIDADKSNKVYDITLTYITGRGNWYYYSWKGDEEKSGGLITNIGIHFFDMLYYLFGELKTNTVHYRTPSWGSGCMHFKKARVRWFLSIDANYLPDSIKQTGKMSYRSILIDKEELDFTNGFTDLHTLSYQQILEGRGFGLDCAKPSIEIVHFIRNAECLSGVNSADKHPFVHKVKRV
ncbi:MAG: Gfo/Idh/MocA family oxidoreductase [Bacteroidales bacterium]|jgi:UDP-N-acetyl-2-amino-2-deoxyglucuronate dehydrogenase|nr:Gfo/Idh/MocA family oxidoreductase [Bacteroidales bacterium]